MRQLLYVMYYLSRPWTSPLTHQKKNDLFMHSCVYGYVFIYIYTNCNVWCLWLQLAIWMAEQKKKNRAKKIKAEWRNWKKYGEGMRRKTKNEKLKNFVYTFAKASPWNRSTALWLFWLSYIVATRWYFFFFSLQEWKTFFFVLNFSFFLKFLHSRHGTALLSMMMMTFVHMYSSHWGTSVSKHMEEFLFSRAIMKKKEKFLHMGIV